MVDLNRIVVLYGSQTFTAQEMAERIWRTTKILGFKGPVQALDEYPISGLIKEEFALFVCATTGQGDEPDNMKKFWKFLLRKSLPSNSLCGLKYGVLGLGDSSYSKFNFVGKKLHKRLLQLGATPLMDVGLCDYQHDLGHDAIMGPWLKEYFIKLKDYFPDLHTDNISSNFVPRWKVKLLKIELTVHTKKNDDIYFCKQRNYNFCQAVLFNVESNIRTTSVDHFQDVSLIKLSNKTEIPLSYDPGDVFNIRPRNSEEDIEDLFDIFDSHGIDIKPHYRLLVEECHEGMPVPEFLKNPLSLYEIAEQYWDLRCYPTQYVFSLLALISEDKLERDKCIELGSAEGQEEWLNYCRRPKRTVLEVLHDFHKSTSKLTIEVLFELFSTIKPRSFSIASSCLPSKGKSLEILVAVVKYNTILKRPRLGLASNWLKDLKNGDEIYGWIKKGTLVFPEPSVPCIMIGPGTGLAPFRSLLQERVHKQMASRETLHLFFGCRYKEKDFHCKEELEKMTADGHLTLYCAFSRDQDDKIYVQHKITEHASTLWKLINDKQGCIFISGNAKNMPDNVKDAFIEDVFSKEGGLSTDDAKSMIKKMDEIGRLQVETW